MSGENKNDQELSAEVIEKYFAESEKHTQDNSSGDKYVDDEDSPDEREGDDTEAQNDPSSMEGQEEESENPYDSMQS